MAFHSYAHLIRKLFNAYRFGPPSRVTGTSAWACVDHLVSRLQHPTPTPSSGSLSLRLGRASASTSPDTATRRLIMQKARRHTQNACSDRLQAHGFRVCFTPLKGVLFTFPSRYLSTIGLRGVFSLAGWSRRIQAGFHVSRPTQGAARPPYATDTGLSPSTAALSSAFSSQQACHDAALQPRGGRNRPGLGSSRFARRYYGNHCYFLFLRVLRCFSSPRWPPRRARISAEADGLSHSDTRGSKAVCAYPRIFAACRVLHRLPKPRHPPCALYSFLPLGGRLAEAPQAAPHGTVCQCGA